MALSQDPKTDTALILRLARQFLYLGNYQGTSTQEKDPGSVPKNHAINAGFSENIYAGTYDSTKQS